MNNMAPVSLPNLQGLVGTWRRFGQVGPVYEIVSVGDTPADGDRIVRVRVLETSEEINYRLADVLDDPKER